MERIEIQRIDIHPTHTYETFKLRPGRPFPFGATAVPVISTTPSLEVALVAALTMETLVAVTFAVRVWSTVRTVPSAA